MSCSSCVALNEKSINELDGIQNISINLATWQAYVEFNKNKTDFLKIKKQIEGNWFNVKINIETEDFIKRDNKPFNRFILSFIFSLPIFIIAFLEANFWVNILGMDLSLILLLIFSSLVVLIFWGHFHVNAFKSILRLNFNMDTLVSLWTLTAYIYSIIAIHFPGLELYFESAAAVVTLINLWRYLEYRAKKKAWDAIWKLIELWVKKANVIIWKDIIQKDIDDVKVWDIVMVKSWEKIPLDSNIVSWSADIDESMLTWESIPVFKEKGNVCFWWTMNLNWNLKLKVTKTNKKWTLSNIIRLVNHAQTSKAPIQKLADRVAWFFVHFILLVSILTFIIWYYNTWDIQQSIIVSVATLVIACPCALWLATPTAIMVWTWVWAKNWILIKNGEALEKVKGIDYIIFDKTWTLTKWKPEVTDIICFWWYSKETLVKYSKSLAKLSNHPLSKSISNYRKNIKTISVKNFKEIKWKWIVWQIGAKIIYIWSRRLFSELNIKKEVLDEVNNLSKEWKTPIIIWEGNKIIWLIWILDAPKDGLAKVIRELKFLGIWVIMLTWDTKKTAEYIANKIWIDKFSAELMPEDKLEKIKEIQSYGQKVAFVWDGINDAPALAQADLAIAMWTWSDIAIESSDIILVTWSLSKIVNALFLSRRTFKIIKQNLFWAFFYNLIWIPLAAFWILNPIFASFAMSMSSVSVVLNSLRLRRFKLRK